MLGPLQSAADQLWNFASDVSSKVQEYNLADVKNLKASATKAALRTAEKTVRVFIEVVRTSSTTVKSIFAPPAPDLENDTWVLIDRNGQPNMREA